MNYYAFSALALSITSIVCGGVSLFHNFRNGKNRLFAIYCLSIVIWSYFYFLWNVTLDFNKALFFTRISLGGAIWIAILHYHFLLILFDIDTSNKKLLLYSSYILCFVFSLINFTSTFVKTIEAKLNFRYYPVPGIVYPIYNILFVLLVILTFAELIRHLKHVPVSRKKEVWLFTIGTSILYGSGLLNFLLMYDIPIPPFLNILMPLSFVMITMVLLNYQLIDVKLVLKKISVGFLIYALLLIIAIPTLIIVSKVLHLSSSLSTIHIIISLGSVMGIFLSFGPLIYAYIIKNSFWLKGHITTGLTHELKSPLNAIQSAADIISSQLEYPKLDKDQITKYIDMIHRNTARLDKFIKDLLHISKIQEGAIEIHKSYISLDQTVASLLESFKPIAQNKNIEFQVSNTISGKIFVDKDKFEQVLSNLITNALKYSDSGTIRIIFTHRNNLMTGIIQDSGKGISKKDIYRIFERFYQASPNEKGTGIGLAVTKAWVEAHGGKIWAESEGEGKGTRIIFTLPASLK